MKLNFVDHSVWATVEGEFEGRKFRATYSSEDGWNAGDGVECLDPDFVGTDAWGDWDDRLREQLWDQGAPKVK